MQLDAILEVAIGLVVTWLIISMATSQVQEFFVELVGWRSNFLKKQVRVMFNNRDELIEQFYDHPLIRPLNTKGFLGVERKPANIPNPIFAKAAVDIFLNAGSTSAEIPAGTMNFTGMVENLNTSIAYLESEKSPLAKTIKFLAPNLNVEAIEIDEKLGEYRKNVESWFDTTMGNASNLYRKNAATIALLIGIALAYIFNVDSLYITNKLWTDPTLRQAIVAQAGNIDSSDQDSLNNTIAKINELSLPVGWNEGTTPKNQGELILKFLGFFITGLAAAQGSPFWFDILRKLGGLKSQPSQSSASG